MISIGRLQWRMASVWRIEGGAMTERRVKDGWEMITATGGGPSTVRSTKDPPKRPGFRCRVKWIFGLLVIPACSRC